MGSEFEIGNEGLAQETRDMGEELRLWMAEGRLVSSPYVERCIQIGTGSEGALFGVDSAEAWNNWQAVVYILHCTASLSLEDPMALMRFSPREPDLVWLNLGAAESWETFTEVLQRVIDEFDEHLTHNEEARLRLRESFSAKQAVVMVIAAARISIIDIEADKELTLGRSEDCDVCLPYEGVSRIHGTLLLQNGEFIYKDALSTNGSWIGADEVREATLSHGEMLRVHNVMVRLSNGSGDWSKN